MSEQDDAPPGNEPDGPPPIGPGDKDTIEMAADTSSPHASLNGTSLDGRERVALARLEGDTLGFARIPARLGLQLGEAVARALDAFAGERDATLLENVDLSAGFQMLLVGETDEQGSIGPDSPAGRGVEQLVALMSVPTLGHLSGLLRRYDDELLKILEQLMRLIVQAQIDLDVQLTREDPPTRLTSARAGAYLGVLQRERDDKDRPVTFIGYLDGVIAPEDRDKREFRLTLRAPWRRRRVIKGSFARELTDAMTDLLREDVILSVEVSRRQHGERSEKLSFHGVSVRAVDDVQLTITGGVVEAEAGDHPEPEAS